MNDNTKNNLWLDTDTDFDENAEGRGNFEPLEPGRYKLLVNLFDIRQTRAKREGRARRGELVKVEFDVLSDKYKGRKLWHNFNIANDSETAERIGRGEFARMARSAGVTLKVEAPPEGVPFSEREDVLGRALSPILGKVVEADVVTEYNDYSGRDENKIKSFVATTTTSGGEKGTESPTPNKTGGRTATGARYTRETFGASTDTDGVKMSDILF